MDRFTVASLKYRRLVARHGPRLAAAIVLVGALIAAGGAVQFAAPPTERVTETVTHGSVDTSVTTEARVTGDSRFYDGGTVLVDEPVYLREAAPELTVTVGTTPPGAEATVEQSLVLVYRAEVDGDRFWTRRETLATEETTVDGGEATVAATINVSAVAAQVRTYEKELGGDGDVSVSVRHEVSYRTADREGEFANAASLTFGRRTYALGGGLGGSRDLTSQRTRVRPDPDANLVVGVAGHDLAVPETGLGTVVLALALFVVAADVRVRYRNGVDLGAVERRLTRTQFEEWISHGRIPTDAGTCRIQVASLDDLVDLAIDCNKRVVYDRARELHAVVDAETVYYYGNVSDWSTADTEFQFLSETELEP
ncbi:hypothetical protein BRC81_04840 [Halobacteriales archaeon QS_1_68_20]|nr:MAG: hypothetical protein BRC81_04840 [Halobacteriales archaeon QS_1_68_20]